MDDVVSSVQFRRVTLSPGIDFEIALDPEARDSLSGLLATGAYPPYDRFLMEMLQRLVPPNGRVLDLGAHLGIFALAAAATGYQVAAVEAAPRNVALLRAGAARNGLESRLTVLHAAVSDREGTLEFFPCGPYGHVATGTTWPELLVRVRAATVDSLVDELGWDRVDLVKMDIEGSEVAAVRGMGRLLSRSDAPYLIYESNGHTLGLLGQTPRVLKAALERHGYRNFLIEPERIVPVDAAEFQPETLVDLLALKGHDPEVLLPRWPLGHRATENEVVQRTLNASRSADTHQRAYLTAALADAPPALRARPEIARLLADLTTPPSLTKAHRRPTWWSGLVGRLRARAG